MSAEKKQPNRLLGETSPYLKQHAYNPVEWYPWGEAAFAKAKAENKPILLSVGYSACHWCHVMAHESFENEDIARMMNEAFINVKVDREERPDVDEIYQRVTQLVTGQGGWPLTVFLDPNLQPIYGGTYFPPEDRYGRPGFPRVLYAVVDAFRNRPGEAADGAKRMVERMREFDQVEAGAAIPAQDVFGAATQALLQRFDRVNGGFGGAPKFPMVADQELLVARYRETTQKELLEAVLFTLQKMATGGIYDQLGGGFHRYSVDPYWLAPHFEKMLYDNALIPRLYLEAYRLSGEAGYARIVHETLQYLLREMYSPEGGFYSSQDADSEGEEGKFFVWQYAEIRKALGEDRARRFADVYDVSETGNWEGKNILRIVAAPADVAQKYGVPVEQFERDLAFDAKKLLAIREQRVKPGRDDKQIAAWNGLALTLFAQAGALLGHEPYLAVARSVAGFVWGKLFDGETGRLRRVYHGEARIDAFLDDYAYMAAGLLDLHRATGEPQWAERARLLVDAILARFRDDTGLLFLTPADGEPLPSRPKSGYDQMLPSPAGVAIQSLYRMFVLTNEERYRQAAEQSLACYAKEIEQHPTAHAGMLAALDLFYRGETTCVVAGPKGGETHRLAQAARRLLKPDEAVLVAAQGDAIGRHLIEGKSVPGGGSAAFVCQGFACMPAARTAEELAERLT